MSSAQYVEATAARSERGKDRRLNVNLDLSRAVHNLAALSSGHGGVEPFVCGVAEAQRPSLFAPSGPMMTNSDHAQLRPGDITALAWSPVRRSAPPICASFSRPPDTRPTRVGRANSASATTVYSAAGRARCKRRSSRSGHVAERLKRDKRAIKQAARKGSLDPGRARSAPGRWRRQYRDSSSLQRETLDRRDGRK